MRLLAIALVLAALVRTQTFIVDVNNGPNTDFLEIAAAVAAVPDGAVLVVRPGSYQPFRIEGKSLTVLGQPGAQVVVSFFNSLAIDVVGLGPQQAVLLRGLTMFTTFALPRLVCRDCDGTVVIDDLAALGSPTRGQIIVSGCGRVFLRNTTLQITGFTIAPIESFGSNLVLENCSIRSEAFCIRQGGGRVVVVDSRLESDAVAPTLPTAALFLAGGELTLTGGSEIVAMAVPVLAAAGVGTIVTDPSTVLQNLMNPPFDPNITRIQRVVPALTTTVQAAGGMASATLTVSPGATGCLFVGFPDAPSPLPGVTGPFWLAPTPALEASGSGPTVSGGYTIPNAPWVLGVAVAWQGVEVDQNGALVASNPAAYAHY